MISDETPPLSEWTRMLLKDETELEAGDFIAYIPPVTANHKLNRLFVLVPAPWNDDSLKQLVEMEIDTGVALVLKPVESADIIRAARDLRKALFDAAHTPKPPQRIVRADGLGREHTAPMIFNAAA